MDARGLIEQVVETYRTARLYTDRGQLVGQEARARWTVDFETAFQQPDRLAFEFRCGHIGAGKPYEYGHRLQAVADRARIGDPEWRSGGAESLDRAVASLTGISFTTAHTIPRLLLPDLIAGRSIFEGEGDAVLTEDAIDGVEHHVITVESTRTWIHPSTLVIRRVERGIGRRVLTTDYRAVLTAGAR